MLTFDGHCKTMDASADGYVRAEACIVMLLTAFKLRGAIQSGGSSVLIRSTFVNQDGRSSSLTAPNGPSQQRVCSVDDSCIHSQKDVLYNLPL